VSKIDEFSWSGRIIIVMTKKSYFSGLFYMPGPVLKLSGYIICFIMICPLALLVYRGGNWLRLAKPFIYGLSADVIKPGKEATPATWSSSSTPSVP
jgi:hypothetical protein